MIVSRLFMKTACFRSFVVIAICGCLVHATQAEDSKIACCSVPGAYDPYMRLRKEFAESCGRQPKDIGASAMLDESKAIEQLKQGKVEVVVCKGSSRWLKTLLPDPKQSRK